MEEGESSVVNLNIVQLCMNVYYMVGRAFRDAVYRVLNYYEAVVPK